MSELSYIIAAYTVSWIGLLGYGAYLVMRDRAAKRLHAAGTAQ